LPPAAGASVRAQAGELQDLKGRIEALRRDSCRRRGIPQQRRRSIARSRIFDLQRQPSPARTGRRERRHCRTELADLDAQGSASTVNSGSQQNQLARLLNRQFVGGDADAMKLLLAGRDPNQAARDQYFLNQLSRAKAEMIQQLRAAPRRRSNCRTLSANDRRNWRRSSAAAGPAARSCWSVRSSG
jgi:septal ring factor EnvC (AmiA/AmiB activator)